ncbi:MAG: substrate-binding domain-containing protein, partial [Candidatus Dormibacteraeota bacterium]|nr:substrate-binding domain-containing protein [Candidatus Dormibacteraeota bacterium]
MSSRLTRGPRAFVARVIIAAGFAGAVLTAAPQAAHANGPTLNGAGSTWVQIALDQWAADIAQQGYTVNYQGVGSSAGRSFFASGQT